MIAMYHLVAGTDQGQDPARAKVRCYLGARIVFTF